MIEKYFIMGSEMLVRSFPDKEINKRQCCYCEHHYYDTLFGGDDEYELCEKGHDLNPDECKDFKEL